MNLNYFKFKSYLFIDIGCWQISQLCDIVLEVGVILRPNLVFYEIEIKFNCAIFKMLEIDLNHVNKNSRSCFSKEEVVSIFMNIVDGLNLAPVDEKQFGNESCAYYIRTGIIENKKYKIVFCICSDRAERIGIITLYRL